MIPADTPPEQVFTKTSSAYSGLGSAIGAATTSRNGYLAAQQEAEANGDQAAAKEAEANVNRLDDQISNQIAALNAVREQFLASLGT